jgi:hypothetical protein
MTASSSGSVTTDLVPVTSYASYEEAQRAVDHLSDEGFPVQGVRIVGVGLRLVEQVLGRLTTLGAAGRGALAGAWFGLLIGLFFGIFAPGTMSFLAIVLWAVLWGAVAGALYGTVSHALTRGQRDFVSMAQLAADRYEVQVPADLADRARALIAPSSV